MGKFKRSKNRIWGTGAMVNFCEAKMMDEKTMSKINRNVYLQGKGIYAPVSTEMRDWQKELMKH